MLSGLEWTPPKGRIDADEDTMKAAFREAKEEAGLEAEMMTVYNDIKAEFSYKVVGWPKTVTLWLARLNDPNQEIKPCFVLICELIFIISLYHQTSHGG